MRARDLELYNDITDCGAGGLSSAVGEMSSKLGCDVELICVRLKYSGLAPWEIWLDRNADLARMLVDYAHERWSAKRSVSPELWRCVGPFAGEAYYQDLVKVLRSGGGSERMAAALALAECPLPEALTALETAPTLWRDIRAGRLTWADVA